MMYNNSRKKTHISFENDTKMKYLSLNLIGEKINIINSLKAVVHNISLSLHFSSIKGIYM